MKWEDLIVQSFLLFIDEDDDDIRDEDLSWYILVIGIWFMMVLFMTY